MKKLAQSLFILLLIIALDHCMKLSELPEEVVTVDPNSIGLTANVASWYSGWNGGSSGYLLDYNTYPADENGVPLDGIHMVKILSQYIPDVDEDPDTSKTIYVLCIYSPIYTIDSELVGTKIDINIVDASTQELIVKHVRKGYNTFFLLYTERPFIEGATFFLNYGMAWSAIYAGKTLMLQLEYKDPTTHKKTHVNFFKFKLSVKK